MSDFIWNAVTVKAINKAVFMLNTYSTEHFSEFSLFRIARLLN